MQYSRKRGDLQEKERFAGGRGLNGCKWGIEMEMKTAMECDKIFLGRIVGA